MKLGFLAFGLSDIAKAGQFGFPGIEMDANAFGNLAEPVAEATIEETKALCATHGVEITAIAFYDIAWTAAVQPDPLPYYRNLIQLAKALDVPVISSMSGFDGSLDWKGNLELFGKRFGPICAQAEEHGLKIALENWMGVGGPPPQKPCNFGGGPAIWDALFEAVPSEALGLEFDPSHLYWQGIDHIRALKEYQAKVFHVHAKDTEMLPEERYRWGTYASPFRFRIPGYGGIDWTRFVATLDEIGYTGGVAIEHEDPIYSGDRFDEGLQRGHHVLFPLVHPGGK
ncbi:MAG TPA: sugar phosphate isomerase/epimerase family protein [Abditibacteriaceae bacterium]|jgi:sugar phosphate isomerase/epimerase